MTQWFEEPIEFDEELDELERLSNGALRDIKAGRLADAERACKELARRFPDQIDWLDHTAALHEARGNFGAAIEYYRRCLDFIDLNPDDFDESRRDDLRATIERLKSNR